MVTGAMAVPARVRPPFWPTVMPAPGSILTVVPASMVRVAEPAVVCTLKLSATRGTPNGRQVSFWSICPPVSLPAWVPLPVKVAG